MNATKLLTALLAVLVVSAGAGAATAASIDAETTTVDASYDDGTVSLTVLENDTGVENVSVTANGVAVGETDENGSISFDTNASELDVVFTTDNTTFERSYEVENGSLVSDTEEVEDDEENETDENESELDASASLDNGTVTVDVTQNGSAAENVSVTANGEDVGTTDENGSLMFETNASEELELEFEKGDVELEQEYSIEDGALVMEEDDEEDDNELSADENASDRAHSVLAVIQQYLNSGGEGNLGQQIQDAMGDDRGNSENAKENGQQNGNADEAPGQSDDDEAEDEAENEQNGTAGDAPGQSKDKGTNGNGNAPDHAGDDEEDDEDDDEEDDEDDDEDDDEEDDEESEE
jgi:hypothetical protein